MKYFLNNQKTIFGGFNWFKDKRMMKRRWAIVA
jgi:hypothetical protein